MSQASIQAVVVARFPLGNIVATCGISDLIHQGAINPMTYLARHVRGDWGDLCDEDRLLNERSVGGGGRLMCWRRFKIEPPCRLNFEPGLMANL